MTSIRSVHSSEGKFVQLTNAAGQDPRLSLEARGIIYFVLSLPPDFHFTGQWLEEHVPNGRDVVRRALRELKGAGYFRSHKKSLGRGRWEWDQVISDSFIPDGDESGNGTFSQVNTSDGNPSSELTSQDTLFPQAGSSDRRSSDDLPANKRSKTDERKTKPSASQRGERATRIPDGFAPSPQMLAWAADRRPDVDAVLQTEMFVNYWRTRAGAGARKLDWPLVWKNWMLKAEDRTPWRAAHRNGHKPYTNPTPPDRTLYQQRLDSA
jgi:hypothetical protein